MRLRRDEILKLIPMFLLLVLLLVVFLLMSNATSNSERFGQLYSWLLIAGALGLLLMVVLIGRSLYRLLQRYRKREPGARLSVRLVLVFLALSVAPLVVVYYFSLQFLQRGIDSWFDVRVEEALEEALELSRSSLSLRMNENLRQTKRIAENLLSIEEDTLIPLKLGEVLDEIGANELTLFGQSGRIIATVGIDSSVIVPYRPPEPVLLHVYQGHDYVSLDPIGDVGFHIRVVVPVETLDPNRDQVILQALFAVPERLGELADAVRLRFDSYRELVYLRGPLKTSFILILTLVLVFAMLAAFWAALFAARRLVAPVRDLVAGTQAVAAGHYDQQLPLASNDELGFLVQSFNQMTRGLAQARDTAQQSQALVEQQRAYLEAVLSRLSSGVITLDQDGILYTHNTAANQILGVNLASSSGAIDNEFTHIKLFFNTLKAHLQELGDWREEITVFSGAGRQVLLCRGSSLPSSVGLKGGHVIVFDDITALVQAQRDAAWGEVAQRLAHEIKNPLTPIQLAAERIRYKCLSADDMNIDASQVRILDRSTHTIIQQVQAMKDMVDAFNQYARAPRLQLQQIALNEFITEVLYLYKDYPAGVEIKLDLSTEELIIEVDPGRLRQLLHNLVKNAIEAMADQQGSLLCISTRCCYSGTVTFAELTFTDDGPGFPAGIGNVFEPYVTTKPKGTGLGLAIVRKIVEEHGGVIELKNTASGGACVVIRFPGFGSTTAPAPLALVHEETE